VIVPEEAERVRLIFQRYLEVGSLGAPVQDLTNETECWSNSSTSLAKSASDRVSRSTL
jgi:hypothetical protein